MPHPKQKGSAKFVISSVTIPLHIRYLIYNSPSHLPRLNLEHATLLSKSLVQVESVEEKVRLVAHTLLETLALGLLVVVCQDGLVLGVSTLVDDDAGALAG